jgi:hypothetical protein
MEMTTMLGWLLIRQYLKTIFNWLKYSGVWVTISLNPFHWDLWATTMKDELSRFGYRYEIQLLFLNIRIVLDDGEW